MDHVTIRKESADPYSQDFTNLMPDTNVGKVIIKQPNEKLIAWHCNSTSCRINYNKSLKEAQKLHAKALALGMLGCILFGIILGLITGSPVRAVSYESMIKQEQCNFTEEAADVFESAPSPFSTLEPSQQ